MYRSVRFAVLNGALALAAAVPAAAQAPNIVADLVADVAEVEKKFMGLANAIPVDKWDWRPGAGVRSVGEVFKHVAADNYLIPAGLGYAADASTGIKGDDYKTAVAYEARKMDKAQTIAELQKSFTHLKTSMQATQAAKLGDQVKLFGAPFTMQRAWILGTTHLHEQPASSGHFFAAAMHSISITAPCTTSPATATVERAGGSFGKNSR